MAENAPSFEVEPVAEAAPRVEDAPVARPEPVLERAAEPQPSAPQPAPLKLEWPSDLVQIETDPHKARAVVVVEEEPLTPRVRRVRPTPPQMPSEPLIQVETQRSSQV
jgi:hypothetical protein